MRSPFYDWYFFFIFYFLVCSLGAVKDLQFYWFEMEFSIVSHKKYKALKAPSNIIFYMFEFFILFSMAHQSKH